MAAPDRSYRSTLPTQPAAPPWERAPHRRGAGKRRRNEAGRRRLFAVLVVVPVLLMLGSVYLHTVSADLQGRATALEERLDATRAEGERLGVKVAELSAADRIRPLAREKLNMRDAESRDLEVYGNTQREDGIADGGEKKGGEPRPR